MPIKDHVCRAGDCYRSYHTEKGREHHEERVHGEVNPDA